jgi:2-keto-4-pentenoate hydratase/2-oxohepta-3-ene-1,7-dioic acid hydratase in catechol pathway
LGATAFSAKAPAGVGFGMTPKTYLAHGDIVDMSITGLGAQRHLVFAG